VYTFYRHYWFELKLFLICCAQDTGSSAPFGCGSSSLETSGIFLISRVRYPHLFATEIVQILNVTGVMQHISAFCMPGYAVIQFFGNNSAIFGRILKIIPPSNSAKVCHKQHGDPVYITAGVMIYFGYYKK